MIKRIWNGFVSLGCISALVAMIYMLGTVWPPDINYHEAAATVGVMLILIYAAASFLADAICPKASGRLPIRKSKSSF